MLWLRLGGNHPGRGNAMSVRGHDLRQFVTRAKYDLPGVDRESIFRRRQYRAPLTFYIYDLVRREKLRSKLLSASEESRSEGPRVSGYAICAYDRGGTRQVEASSELTPIEILARQS